jgi:rsbT co-antagonist protein RsbR
MSPKTQTALPRLLEKNRDRVVADWAKARQAALKSGQAVDSTLSELSDRFIDAVTKGAQQSQFDNIMADEWASARVVLEEVSRDRASKGFSPTETATFVLSLKGPVFDLLRRELKDAEKLGEETWNATLLFDKLGLYTVEIYQKTREDIIARQQEELLELSTPVVQLWKGILALPLIGTLDSARTQVVMENLLQEIVKTGAEVAIIDITGVPTVDTLVAQHLLKTVAAARLMGADCLISGIRPQIAQTIVHLGVELNVVSKATMADAFGVALRRTGRVVVDRSARSEARLGAEKKTSGADAE